MTPMPKNQFLIWTELPVPSHRKWLPTQYTNLLSGLRLLSGVQNQRTQVCVLTNPKGIFDGLYEAIMGDGPWSFTLLPGIKTNDQLGAGRWSSAEGWAVIAEAIAMAIQQLLLMPGSFLLFDHESTFNTGGYLTGVRPVPGFYEMFPVINVLNEFELRYAWYPGVRDDYAPAGIKREHYLEMVRAVTGCVTHFWPDVSNWGGEAMRLAQQALVQRRHGLVNPRLGQRVIANVTWRSAETTLPYLAKLRSEPAVAPAVIELWIAAESWETACAALASPTTLPD